MTTEPVAHADPFAARRRWFWPVASITAAVAWVASLSIGAVEVPIDEVIRVVASHLGAVSGSGADRADAVVWAIRMPRTLTGFTVGATLGLVGVVLQGVLRNRLADPHILGIGPGAAIGAAIGAIAGGVRGSVAGGVFAGVMTAFILRRLARRASIDPTRIILSGVALAALLSAWVGFVVFGADRASVAPIEFWLLGSLSGVTWTSFGMSTVFVGLAIAGLLTATTSLDIMALGDAEARHLGIDTDLVTTMVLIGSGAAVGATVGTVGVISFVGLVIPFILRPVVGQNHRYLLPAAMLAGGVFVVLADLIARMVFEPIEMPVGLITASVGGPIFLWLLSKERHD